MTTPPPRPQHDPPDRPPEQPWPPPVPPGDPMASAERLGEPPTLRAQYRIKLSKPYITRALMAINALVFAAMVIYGFLVFNTIRGTEDLRVLIFFGAKVNELIVEGQTWRLFTAMFIHIGVFHLLVNLYALFALGPLVEGYYGSLRFLAIYLIGGLFGSLASYAFSDAVSAGASGAIFGLAGAITVFFMRYRDNFGAHGRSILQNMLVIIGINLVFGLTVPGIDNWGHIGGLIGGALVAFGLMPRYNIPAVYQPTVVEIEQEDRRLIGALWVSVTIALLIFGVDFVTRLKLG